MTAHASLRNGAAKSSLGNKNNQVAAQLQSDVTLDAFRQIAKSIDDSLRCRKPDDMSMILNLQNVKRDCSVLSKKLELGEQSTIRVSQLKEKLLRDIEALIGTKTDSPTKQCVKQVPQAVPETASPSAPEKGPLGPFQPRTRASCTYRAPTVASSWMSRTKNSTPMVRSSKGVAVAVKTRRSRSTSSGAASVSDRRSTVPAQSRRSLRIFPKKSPPSQFPVQESGQHRAPRPRIPTLLLSNPQCGPVTPKQDRSPSPVAAGNQTNAAQGRCSETKEKLEAEEPDLRRQLKEALERCQMLEEKIRCQEMVEVKLKQTLNEERKAAMMSQKDELLTPSTNQSQEDATEEALMRERREKEELQKSMATLQSTFAITEEKCRSLEEALAVERGAMQAKKELEAALASERSEKEEVCNHLREAKELCDATQQQLDRERRHGELNAEWWMKSQQETQEMTFGLQEAWRAEKEAMTAKMTKLQMDLELVHTAITASEVSEDKLRDEISSLQQEVASLRSGYTPKPF